MTHVSNVFVSRIRNSEPENNLLELFQKKVVADDDSVDQTPIETTVLNEDVDVLHCPETKPILYALKPKTKRVKTVRDIRFEYEAYVYEYLKSDLYKQRQTLYDRIIHGALREETLNIVNKILNSDESISRATWDMITNLNPYNFLYKKQFVICNGSKIKVNGSMGGKKEILYNDKLLKRKIIKKNKSFRKKSLLYNTNLPKFKPGPLSKKYLLDESHQLHNIGRTELVKLPNIGVDITPLSGAVLEPKIANYILGKREENGVITEKWAEFAAGVVGTIVNGKVLQYSKDTSITFNVDYKNNQNRILMRNCDDRELEHTNTEHDQSDGNKTITEIVESVVENLIESVIISVHQNDIDYDTDIANEAVEVSSQRLPSFSKEKVKKTSELKRLHVTIIRLAEETEDKMCEKAFCKLGCICSSLECRLVISEHCGREDCMFKCNCGNSDRRDLRCNSQLINLNNKLHSRLSKEEQKFQQTVVVSNDKPILLNSRKRGWDNSSHIPEIGNGEIKELKVSVVPLVLGNVQNFCMVHELYKCFCKNRFLESSYKEIETTDIVDFVTKKDETKEEEAPNASDCQPKLPRLSNRNVRAVRYKTHEPLKKKMKGDYKELKLNLDSEECDLGNCYVEVDTCARVMPYVGRKYSIEHYRQCNNNIRRMEDNDAELQTKFNKYYTSDTENNSCINVTDHKVINRTVSSPHFINNEKKLQILIVNYYKMYKNQKESGCYKRALDTPVPGKICLFPWNDVLHRYKNKSNYFYATTKFPFRIFLTIQPQLPNLYACVNIDDIRVSELHKFPEHIKSLITGIENKHKFCILYGQTGCWEVKGAAKKIDESEYVNIGEEADANDNDTNFSFAVDVYNKTAVEKNKWFILTVEKSFCEIRLQDKGFFVKSENVIRSIELAKLSGKPVRLSPQSSNQFDLAQFGIYATPTLGDSRALVGPYGELEDHGIAITMWDTKRTKETIKGFWIINKKEENLDVLDNPILFLERKNVARQEIEALYEQIHVVDTGTKKNKPIKICKSNTFYLTNTNGFVQPLVKPSVRDNGTASLPFNDIAPILKGIRRTPLLPPMVKNKAENIDTSNDQTVSKSCSPCMQRTTNSAETRSRRNIRTKNNVNSEKDDDILVISDEESHDESRCIPVWIECVNINSLGCLVGRKDKHNKISFIFPKSDPSPFLKEQEAFDKINQILSTKLYIKEGLDIIWKVVEERKDIINPILLKEEDYAPDLILTEEGIIHNSELASNASEQPDVQCKDVHSPVHHSKYLDDK